MAKKIDINEKSLVNLINTYLPADKQVPEHKSEDLIKFIKSISKIINNPKSTENVKKAKEWFEIAKSDIESSKTLYNAKHYRNSMMLLQQSVEKLAKCFCMAFYICSEKDLRKFSHKSPLAFVEMIKQDWVEPFVSIMHGFYPKLNTDTEPLIKTIRKNQHEIATIPEEDIIKLFNALDNIESISMKKDIQMKPFIENILDEFSDYMDKEKLKDLKTMQEYSDIIRFATSFLNLFIISVLTYPHLEYSRYPDTKVKPEIYTQNLGIVKKAPVIFKRLNKPIEQLDKFLMPNDV